MNQRVWSIASVQQVDAFIEIDPTSYIYGWATPLRKSSIAWLSHSNYLAILSSPGVMYPDLPSVLQLYCLPNSYNSPSVNIDEIPNLPSSLVVYTTSEVCVMSSKRKVVKTQNYRRFEMAYLKPKIHFSLNLHQVTTKEYASVINLYRSATALRFHPKFLEWGSFVACWDSSEKCIGAYGTHVYAKNNAACLLGHLYVLENWRGCGVGTALVSHLTHLVSSQFTRLFCDIEPTNYASIRVHTQVGYKPTDKLMKMLFYC